MPADPTTNRGAAFTFTSTEPGGATFACRLLRGGTVVAGQDWAACDSGTKVYDATVLDLGTWTFEVRASDDPDPVLSPVNTDPTPASYTWTIEAPVGPPPTDQAPDTRITDAPRRWHLDSFLGLSYEGVTGDDDVIGFQCRLNDKPLDCGDGQALVFLRGGDHRFTVAAVDEAGNVDPTPAVSRWSVPSDATRYSRGWTRGTDLDSRYFRDTFASTRRKGAFAYQGRTAFRSAVLLAVHCPGCGRIEITRGPDLLRRVDLAAAARRRDLIVVGNCQRPQRGRITVTVVSKGKDVILDAMGFSQRRT